MYIFVIDVWSTKNRENICCYLRSTPRSIFLCFSLVVVLGCAFLRNSIALYGQCSSRRNTRDRTSVILLYHVIMGCGAGKEAVHPPTKILVSSEGQIRPVRSTSAVRTVIAAENLESPTLQRRRQDHGTYDIRLHSHSRRK